jgi:two-component system sensor histidine kinase KdpD
MDEQRLTNGHSVRHPVDVRSVRVMVCVGYNPVSQRLIQRAGQIAGALGGELIAVHIQPTESEVPGYQAMLEQNLAMARQLGAQIVIERGTPLAQVLARVAQAHGVTHIVMGESARSRWAEIRNGSLVRQLLRASRGVDVYIVADPA